MLLGLLGLLGVIAIFVAAALWVLANLDHPWVKGKVEHALSELVGTDLRYERLSVSLSSGLRLGGLVLETPETLRSYAPDMLRFEELHVPIELRPLLSGEVVIPEIRGGAATVTVVITKDGRSSFGELADGEQAPSDEPSGEGSAPLSRSLEVLHGLSLRVGSITLAPIRLQAVEVAGGNVTRRTDLRSLAISSDGLAFGSESNGSLSLGPHGSDVVTLTVREPEERGSAQAQEPRRAQFEPRVQLRLEDGRTVALDASAELHAQSLFPELRPVRTVLDIASSATFEPTETRTTLHVDDLALLDSMVVAEIHATVHDDWATRLDAAGKVEAASLPWALPGLSIDELFGEFDIRDLEITADGVTTGRATLTGKLQKAHYVQEELSFSLGRMAWSGVLSAPTDPARTLDALKIDVAVDELTAQERGRFVASIDDLATTLELHALGADDQGMWGLEGRGSLTGSIKRASVKTRTRVMASKVALTLDVDLGRHRIAGRVPIQSASLARVGYDRIGMRGATLDLVVREPLHWPTDDGTPAIEVEASVERVSVGERHFRAPAWSVAARRTAPDHYALETRLTAERMSGGRLKQEPQSSLSIEATLDTNRPAIDSSADLSIAGGATINVSLSASHSAPTTRYSLDLQGAQAGPLLGAMLFGDGGRRSDELGFAFESRGELDGLLVRDRTGALTLGRKPLGTLRGTHRSKLTVERLALRREGAICELQGLNVEARSTHEAPGRGALEVTASFEEARYGEEGWHVTAHDYIHDLQLAYAAIQGAPSFSVQTKGTLGALDQPFFRQYPVRDVSFGAEVDVDDTQVVAVREAFLRNPAGGTRFEARGAYEGWREAVRDTDVCTPGLAGCPQIASMYGREAATVTGILEQDFGSWESTDRITSSGSFAMPFTVESGDLSTYRVLATAEFRDVTLELPQHGLLIEDLDALIPLEQEIATRPEFFVFPAKTANAMAQKRFFDLYPFTQSDSFFTVDRLELGEEVVGPVAANVRIAGSAMAIDQIHAAYRGGFITGQVLADLSKKDAAVVFRGNVTNVETTGGRGVLDANVAMTFVPAMLSLEGKAQVVRVSKDHLYEILDALDPYHENEGVNRVRLGLKFGYPKFVLLKLDEGLMNAKIDLGGLVGVVRIDEIKGIPVTPLIEQYLQPYLERVSSPSAVARTMATDAEGTR